MPYRLAIAVLISGCAGDEPQTPVPDPTETPTPDPTVPPPTSTDGPSWNGDVQRIVAENCAGCHQAGGIGTFALETYDDAAPWALAMAQAVEARTMPPWLVTDDGTCGDFADSRWMSDADIQTLVDWADAGAPEGPDAQATPIPTPLGLDRIDHTLVTPTIVPEVAGGWLRRERRVPLLRPGQPCRRRGVPHRLRGRARQRRHRAPRARDARGFQRPRGGTATPTRCTSPRWTAPTAATAGPAWVPPAA